MDYSNEYETALFSGYNSYPQENRKPKIDYSNVHRFSTETSKKTDIDEETKKKIDEESKKIKKPTKKSKNSDKYWDLEALKNRVNRYQDIDPDSIDLYR